MTGIAKWYQTLFIIDVYNLQEQFKFDVKTIVDKKMLFKKWLDFIVYNVHTKIV